MYLLSDEDIAVLRRLIKWTKNLSGPNVINRPDGATIGATNARQRVSRRGKVGQFWIRLTSSTSIGDNRWSYAAAEAEPDKLGVWKTKDTGWTGTAYNTFESFNSATGVQGSGDNVANFPSGVALQPIGPAVVPAWRVVNCDGDEEIHFSAPNNPGGACA